MSKYGDDESKKTAIKVLKKEKVPKKGYYKLPDFTPNYLKKKDL